MELTPMEHRVLEILPPEGLIGGVHYRGRIAVDIANEILEGISPEDRQYVHINGLTVGNVLTNLQKVGLVKQYGKSSQRRIWARTPKGTEILNGGSNAHEA